MQRRLAPQKLIPRSFLQYRARFFTRIEPGPSPSGSPHLVDTFQRKHDYLRISLTEKCNLRCIYCMPMDGVELSPKEHILSDGEIVRLANLFVRNGVSKIRLTGGEPTIRKGISDIIRLLSELRPLGLKAIGMTSNGLVLHRQLPTLVANGLTHLNLSLDTLDPAKFSRITRRESRGHEAVLHSLHVALSLMPSLQSVKINVVVIKGVNDSELLHFVAMTKDHQLSVRFIEYMPFTGNKWDKTKMVSSATLLSAISTHYPLIAPVTNEPNDTARSFTIPGHKGSIGFISSMSDHFCRTCNRLRITADGKIKVCLFDSAELSLRDAMRSGASDDELMALIGQAVFHKKEKHAGMEHIDVVRNRPMILIGAATPYLSAISLPAKSRSITSSLQPPSIRFIHSQTAVSSGLQHLTHLDESGRPRMVDVSRKPPTRRMAMASGRICLNNIAFTLACPAEAALDQASDSPSFAKAQGKGDVLTVAQIAGIMAAKQTPSLIPLCHAITPSTVAVTFIPDKQSTSILCQATVECIGQTGVEMEALTAVSGALLTIWDMVKAVAGQEMEITEVMVTRKAGGSSGDFTRKVLTKAGTYGTCGNG